MKRIAAAFTALFVLASCLMAGGSIYMHAHRNDLEITGEVLYGERAMASGIEVRQSVLIDGHPNWEVSYSPAAASHVTQAGWSLPELRRTAARPPAISIGSITSGLTISYDSGRSGYGNGYDGGSRKDGGYGSYEEDPRKRWFQSHNIHYIDLNKWYWKLLFGAIAILLIVLVFSIVSGIFALLIQFAGPILLILFLYWFIKSLRR